MKNINSLRIVFTLLFVAITHFVMAQASDPTSAPPPTGTADKIICSSQGISIVGPQNAGVDYPAYQWYKLDAAGVAHLTTTTTRTYTETPSGAGYYSYQLVTVNANGCTSPMSDVFKIYVLPPITATITTSVANNTICANNQSSIVLTATPSNPAAYTYTYQWTKNGTNIPGATSNTYTLSEAASGSVNMGVIISYTLNSGCSATATQSITVDPIPVKPTIGSN
ncbi:hypothetical protein KXQ82_18385 [Mucilaginibacter sp. HMF5004]|uniref:hypothetical protein n=1 Tax=Mucilaginibacter rivuli TaxID=2857527 RepID=UPI001C5ECEFA|nr:hypothetical protein [Mucilaginibacter rivuli]MBW4891699.1 hypothetical protein [Mucilaginibacter rivuli]